MIISASRRTDIPAFYAEWFIKRIQGGYCTVPNPFNRKQITTVSLTSADVDVIVFWTRNPRPLMPHLPILDEQGLKYCFQYTLMGNPKQIDPLSPNLDASLEAFSALSDQIGADKVIWRYDPLLFSQITHAGYHVRQYEKIASALEGKTHRSVISIVDEYAKNKGQFRSMAEAGIKVEQPQVDQPGFMDCIREIVAIAANYEMVIFSCAEDLDLTLLGVKPGKCIDDDYIQKVFGINVTGTKDPNQRKPCGCVVSKDIGMYNTCLYGCQYCYATRSLKSAKNNQAKHDPDSPSLLGWYVPEPSGGKDKDDTDQLSLF